MLKISELADRDIINLADGSRLGPVKDAHIDPVSGQLEALVIQSPKKYLRLFRAGRDIVVPWEKIVRIGVDAILVEVPPYR